jgi:hypothetical protein
MRHERRSDERRNRDHSLTRWLDAVATKTGVTDLVVADSRGLLVAASREHDATARIAAVGSTLPSSVTDALAVLRIRAPEDGLRLCATGEMTSRLEGLLMAEPGVVRILCERMA